MNYGALKFATLAEAHVYIDKHQLPEAAPLAIWSQDDDPFKVHILYYQLGHKHKVAFAAETAAAAAGAPAADLLATWTLPANIMDLAVPVQRYAIKPYFPLECATGLAGQGKVGKSYLTLYALLCVAAGRRFLGCEVTGGDAWYFSAEDRPDRVMERAQAILAEFTEAERALAVKRFHAIDAVGKNLFFVAMVQGGAVITNVAERIGAAAGKAVLIVVDTVSRINPLSEQSNETMALIVAAAEKIAGTTGAAVVLNTHTGKQQARSGETDMYTARGGSAFGDNARSIVVLSRATNADAAKLIDKLQVAQSENNLLILTHAASSYGREAASRFLLRRANGTLAAVEGGTLRDTGRDAETEMHRLVTWFTSVNERAPFSETAIARTARSQWTDMGERAAKAFIKNAIQTGRLTPQGSGQYVPSIHSIDPFAIN
jgi:RecA-family ATPase